MSFTPVMNDEPVLTSAIVNGHQFRALLYRSVTSFIKRAFVTLGRLDYIYVHGDHTRYPVPEMTLNADGQALS